MRVSAILPVYNGREYLRQTLESVLDQTYDNLEVIAVDDGSQDGSLDILNDYKNDIIILSQENAGVSAARNKGVDVSQGEILAFIDQDDIWYPHKIERQLEVFSAHEEKAFIYSDLDIIDTEGNITKRCGLEQMKAKWMGPFIGGLLHPYPSAVMVKKAHFLAVGGFDAAFLENGHEDVDLWIHLYAEIPFVFIPEALIQYRFDNKQRKNRKRRFEVEAANGLYLHQKLTKLFGDDPLMTNDLNRLLAVSYANKGKVFLFEGSLKEARAQFKEAYRVFPAQKRNKWRYWRTFLPAFLHRHVFSD